jgi:hypothetical protein
MWMSKQRKFITKNEDDEKKEEDCTGPKAE